MNEINCEVYLDLLPLVKDGIASEESRQLVLKHIETCDKCRPLYNGEQPPTANNDKAFQKLKRWIGIGSSLLLMFAIYLGLSLTGGEELFYNALIMPFVGVLGYVIFRWKAVFITPIMVLVTHGAINLIEMAKGAEYLPPIEMLMWTGIYLLFVTVGFVIAFLLHIGLKRDFLKKKILKIVSVAGAVVFIFGLGLLANAVVGNPISKAIATSTANKYLATTYADTDFVIDSVNYSFKDGSYYAQIKSPGSIDTHFSLNISGVGKLKYDSYENHVLEKFNTSQRLETMYRQQTNYIFDSPFFPFESDIAYGELVIVPRESIGTEFPSECSIPLEDLEIDKQYNMAEIARKSGHLVIYIEDEIATIERAGEILLEIRRIMDGVGVPFCSIDLVLRSSNAEDIRIDNFLYSDIYEEELACRVKTVYDATKAYYAEQDSLKQ